MPCQAHYYGCVRKLLENLDHNKLHALGLTVWQPRVDRHPRCIATEQVIPQHIRWNARCLVVLYAKNKTAYSAAETKILAGMLSVLNLSSDEIMLVHVYGDVSRLENISTTISQWAPQYILQLSTEMPAIMSQDKFICTYSPTYLLANPQFKPETYKALLTLRAMLHGT